MPLQLLLLPHSLLLLPPQLLLLPLPLWLLPLPLLLLPALLLMLPLPPPLLLLLLPPLQLLLPLLLLTLLPVPLPLPLPLSALLQLPLLRLLLPPPPPVYTHTHTHMDHQINLSTFYDHVCSVAILARAILAQAMLGPNVLFGWLVVFFAARFGVRNLQPSRLGVGGLSVYESCQSGNMMKVHTMCVASGLSVGRSPSPSEALVAVDHQAGKEASRLQQAISSSQARATRFAASPAKALAALMAANQPKAGLRVGGKEDAEAELKEAQDAFEAAVRADAEGESQTAAGSAEGAQNRKGHSLAGGRLGEAPVHDKNRRLQDMGEERAGPQMKDTVLDRSSDEDSAATQPSKARIAAKEAKKARRQRQGGEAPSAEVSSFYWRRQEAGTSPCSGPVGTGGLWTCRGAYSCGFKLNSYQECVCRICHRPWNRQRPGLEARKPIGVTWLPGSMKESESPTSSSG